MFVIVIEVASWPPDLTQWSPEKDSFYLEFFGETSPVLDTALAEVVPAGETDPLTASPAPVYEYRWTLGHAGAAPHREEWDGVFGTEPQARDQRVPLWETLREDVAARVYMYFPISGGWRVREIVATVKYLTPVHNEQAWWAHAADAIKPLLPLAGDAGTVAGFLPGGATASKWLQTVGKLQLGSVPQSEFPWSVEKVTYGGNGKPVMQGVLWNLPASLLKAQGGRLTGSLAVSVLPATQQAASGPASSPPAPQCTAAKAHAAIYPKSGEPRWLPAAPRFIDLLIAPQLPPTRKKKSQQ